jgi:hypothetical protein
MSTIQHIKTPSGNTRTIVATWPNLANGDDGETIKFSQYADKSAQVFGTFGAGGSLRIEGSNDGENWAVLTDPQGNDLVFTSAKIEMVTEATLHVRPKVTAGDGTTALTVVLLMKE